jgi:hypothetical protein
MVINKYVIIKLYKKFTLLLCAPMDSEKNCSIWLIHRLVLLVNRSVYLDLDRFSILAN